MSDTTPEAQEKLAAAAEQVQEAFFQDVYLPAFVQSYNTKAAAAGVQGIQSEDDLRSALDVVSYIETQKQAQAQAPSDLQKAAGLLAAPAPQTQFTQENVQAASQSENLQKALGALSSANG